MKSFVKFRSKHSRRRQAHRFSPWQSALERLEPRSLLSATISAPGTQTTLEDTAKVISGLSFTSSADPVTVTLIATNGTITLSANVSGGLTAGDITGNGTASVTVIANVANVNTTLANAAGLTFIPSLNFNNDDGSASLAVSITNSDPTTVNTTIPVLVTPVNDAPAFTLSSANPPAVNEDAALQSIPFVTSVIVGPSNESSQAITKFNVTSVTTTGGLTFGTALSIDPITGNLSYQPAANSSGTATFSVTATDNGGTANSGSDTNTAQTFIITVNPINDAPTIAAPSTQTTAEETAKVISGLSLADVDAGSANVTMTLAVNHGTLTLIPNIASGLTATQITANGTASVTINAPLAAINTTLANASGLTYTPATDFNGNDPLTVTIDDLGNTGGGGSQTGITSVPITITAVNDAPTITNPGTTLATEDTAKVISGLSFADVDAATSNVTVTLSVTNGTLTINTAVAAGLVSGNITNNGGASVTITASLAAINTTLVNATGLTYTPTTNFNGNDTLSISINDNGNTGSGGALTASTTASIAVAAANDAPTIAAPGAQTTAEDTAKVITSLSFADADAGTGNVMVTLTVTNGKLSVLPDVASGLTATQITANGTASVTITAPLAAINATLANAVGLTYTSATDFNGSDSLGITIDDQGNTGGGALTATTSVPITVTAVNDPPTFLLGVNPPAVAGNPPPVTEDSPGIQTVLSFASSISVGPTNEVASQTISNFTVTAGATTGGLTFLTTPSINPITGDLTYQPALNSNGTATFTVTLTDSGSNTSPNVNTSASKTFVITVTALNDAPTIAAPAAQTTPQGTAKIITGLSFADLDAGTANVTVTLTAPGGKLTVLGNVTNGVSASQITGNTTANVTITAPLAAINATLANAAGLTYTPNTFFIGFDSLTISIDDNGNAGNAGNAAAISTSTVSIFVVPANGATVITEATPNVTYTAPANTKLRAVVVNGLLMVSFNGIAQPFFQNTAAITSLTINGGSKADEIDLTGLSANYPALTTIKLNGGAGNDKITGSDKADSIDGGSGKDTLQGGLGNDTIVGGSGNDGISGQSGDDSMFGGDGNDTVLGGIGIDTLFGGKGNDLIIGGDGGDSLIGDAGRDTVCGGQGGPERGSNGASDAGDTFASAEVINEAFKKLFAFE